MLSAIRTEYRVHGRNLRDPGLWAMLTYRFGVWARQQHFAPCRWILGKIYGCLAFLSVILTGMKVDRGARIGNRFRVLHAGGIFISNRAVIGDDVIVMHNVTIGVDPLGRAPTIHDGVFIGPGACILGHIQVGAGSRIGPNAVVMQDIPENTIVTVPAPTKMPNLSPPVSVVKINRIRRMEDGAASGS